VDTQTTFITNDLTMPDSPGRRKTRSQTHIMECPTVHKTPVKQEQYQSMDEGVSRSADLVSAFVCACSTVGEVIQVKRDFLLLLLFFTLTPTPVHLRISQKSLAEY
jgi:hypothetical protein